MNSLDVLPTGPILPGETLGTAASLQRMAQADADPAKAEKVAKDFEAILLHRLMEEMRRTIPKSELLETAVSSQMDGLFWFYLAQEVAEKGGIGLWKDLSGTMGPAAQETPAHGVSEPKT